MSFTSGPFNYNRFDIYEGKSKPDYLDFDKDGDKKEPMKKALKEKGKKNIEEKKELPDFIKKKMDEKKGKGDCGCDKEPCECDKKKEVKEGNIADAPSIKKEEAGPQITKDDVIAFMMHEGMANNEVSAEAIFNHISDEYLESIEEAMMEGYMPRPDAKMDRQADKAYKDERRAVENRDDASANRHMHRRNKIRSKMINPNVKG